MSKNKLNKFYTINYYKMISVNKASDDTLLSCKIYNNVTANIITELESKFSFETKEPEVLKMLRLFPDTRVFSLEGYIQKKYKREATLFLNNNKNIDTKIVFTDNYVTCFCEIPGGYLFSGWNTCIRTKLKASDLPESYVYTSNYKKHGYIETAGVCDIAYKPSVFHNHAFKDDFLFISYDAAKLFEDKDSYDDLYMKCDQYIFGNDIVNVIKGIEKNNKENDELQDKIEKIKQMMVNQYNLFVEETGRGEKVNIFEEILG